MTSMDSEAVASILCTCKQTRFNIGAPNYRELDIEGLNITVATSNNPGAKGKAKSKSDGLEILNNAILRLKAGQRYALVGRNGTGKSTLLKAIAAKLIPGIPEETRVVILQQTDLKDGGAGGLPPVAGADKDRGLSVVGEVVERATSRHELEKEISILSAAVDSSSAFTTVQGLRKVRHNRLQKDLFLKDKDARLRSGARGSQARKVLIAIEKEVAEYESLYHQKEEEITPEVLAKESSEAADLLAELEISVEPSKLAETESRAKKILTGLGFSEAYMEKPVSSLSGGWKMRTALAAALLQETDILILDEPTNYLDLFGIMWLQRHLSTVAEDDEAPTLILVSHDRDFISLCTDLLIIKEKGLVYFHGDLPLYESTRAEKKAHMTKMKEAKDKQKEHIQQTIVRNMKEGRAKDDQNKVRQAKSRQKKLDDRWGLEVGLKGGRFKLNRDLVGFHVTKRADMDIEQDQRPIHFPLPEPPELRFPGPLISLEKVSFRYPPAARSKIPSPAVLQDITLSVGMGDRIGILGLNGGGKSTLIRLLVGEAKPTAGNITTHPRLRLGYYSQHAVEELQKTGAADRSLTSLALLTREVAAAVSISGGEQQLDEGDLRGLLGALGLPGRLASDVPVAKLSGGQLVRLELARLLWRSPHCLVLDEATTHLDYESVTALREALRAWEGAVVVVSHDRWFVRGVVEGLVDEDGDASDSGGGGDDEGSLTRGSSSSRRRRRVVYRLSKGQMKKLEGGVQEFEDSMEKKVQKLMKS